jgi:LysR family transcriptional regulator, glycine cleavage system transcriptional activator
MGNNPEIRRKLPSMMAVRAFESAARLGSFTLAANELLLTQSAISRHVRNLEESLGVKLFKRTGRRLSLTLEGRDYMTVAGDAFDRIAAATVALRRRPQADVLNLSMPPSVAAKWFAPRLQRFMEANPTVDVRINANCRLVDIENDGIDVGIRYGLGNWAGVNAEPLIREEVFPVCSPRLLGSPSRLKSIDDLAHVTLLHEDIREDWRMWMAAAGRSNIDVARGPKFDDASSLMQATIDGLGVGLGRTLLATDDLHAGRLVTPFKTRLTSEWLYWLVTPRDRKPHPQYVRLRNWILQEIEQSKLMLASMT